MAQGRMMTYGNQGWGAYQPGGLMGAMGGMATSTGAAENAVLNFELEQKRQEILRAMGYNVGGRHIMGELEMEAGRQMADLERNRLLTIEDVTNAMREGGALFSGVRAREQARGEYPIVQQMARTKEDVGRGLGQLAQMLADIERERSVRGSMILADEARSRQASMMDMYGMG